MTDLTTHGNGVTAETEERCGECKRAKPPYRKGLCGACYMADLRENKRKPNRRRVTPPATPRAPKPKPRPPLSPILMRAARDVGFLIVAVVCAVVSYTHIRHLALTAGMGQAGWIPLGIDGLMIVCTASWVIDARAGRKPHPVAKLGLLLGVVGTLAANALAVDPDLAPLRAVRIVLAVYPAAALAVVLHLVFLRAAGER